MKVAYILPYLQKPSGWRNHSISFLNAIRQHIEPVLFVSKEDYPIAWSIFPGTNIYPLPVTQQASLEHLGGIHRLAACYWTIHRERYPSVELVHSLEAYPTGLSGVWLAGKLGCPHAITTHGTYGVVWHGRGLDDRAYRYVLKRTSLLLPVSHGTAELVKKYFGHALTHTCVRPILNGNDDYRRVPRQQAFTRPLPDIPTLISIGDVKPRKGQHISLAAFARVKAELPQARYFIIGEYSDNDYFRSLQLFIAERQLQDVTFTGRVSDDELQRHYREASLFVLTPQDEGLHFEGFGLVYLEAGAYGLPVVATRTGGVPDAVKDGETGFLRDPQDVEGIAEAILNLLTNPALARRMGRANREWADNLTWERNATEHVRAYQELLATERRSSP